MKDCNGFGPGHSKNAVIGEYKNETILIKGRIITVRNVEVRHCGCQRYPRLGPMLDLLLAHPRKTVVTWHSKAKEWR